jgi:hypothetical protein
MQPSFYSLSLKSVLLVTQLTLVFCSVTVAQAGGKNAPLPRTVTARLHHPVELSQGYLIVYSATDQFNDGGVAYYPHSSYTVFTTDGARFKSVENHISLSDEVPELITLPVGSYIIEARSEKEGFIRVRVAINKGVGTVLDLDGEKSDLSEQLFQASHSQRLEASTPVRRLRNGALIFVL